MWKRLDLNSDKNPFKKAKRCREKSFETSHWLPNAGRHPLKAMHARVYKDVEILDDKLKSFESQNIKFIIQWFTKKIEFT